MVHKRMDFASQYHIILVFAINVSILSNAIIIHFLGTKPHENHGTQMDLVADFPDLAVTVIMAAHDVIDDKSDGQAGQTQDGRYDKVFVHIHNCVPDFIITFVLACYLNRQAGDKRRRKRQLLPSRVY